MPAGGPATQVDDCGADKYKRPEFNDGKEPSNWHNLGEAFPEEIYHSYNIKRVVVFSGLDGTFVYTALANTLQVILVTFSDDHRKTMHKNLLSRVWKDMQAQGSPLYQAGLVELLKNTEQTQDLTNSGEPTDAGTMYSSGADIGNADLSSQQESVRKRLARLQQLVDGSGDESPDEQ